ncbi:MULTISPECIES: HIT family protein [Halomonas]|jgi:diadenosine tetraphosphate (Ap4A) HIT family hydrolase|uniref:HIT family protein n=1 Tax=Halomonas mongoliensis TaxID=321265 RepID=A0ABU1GPR0_9GAMM|nr:MULTISPECIES: HIT family protein [Halomonas]MDR5893552.1 HIT family protein [Halomonas mongoliensis]PWV81599.1 diadenosine tetraphosphate (Ap4A) HIT family hydrolase [Halomonas sp. A11-A]
MASVFTRIIQGEIPGHFVHEDDQCVVIMTIQPMKPGHVLVIPREEVDHWDDLSEPLYQHLMSVSRRLAKAIKRAFPCKRVGMLVVGLEVPHVHIHLTPLDEMSDIQVVDLPMADQADLAAAAEKLRAALAA